MKKYLEVKSEELLNEGRLMMPSRIKAIRASYELKQDEFAELLNISYNTYRNWEIGHRNPCTSAVALLTLAEKEPKVFLKKQKQFLARKK
jgi:DNA-binding transcriptional regulator YiaG